MFLADMGVSGTTVRRLRDEGHDAVHLRDEGLQRLPDDEVLAKAVRENRIVLTFDLDFGDLLATRTATLPSVVIFRLRDARPATVSAKLRAVLADPNHGLEQGSIVIVEDGRYRVRRLPILPDTA
jgi:predicted nuclease of predicted toxin-antitoxin system